MCEIIKNIQIVKTKGKLNKNIKQKIQTLKTAEQWMI